MTKHMRLIVVLDLENDGEGLPKEQDIINVLAHSTATEALETALQCRVNLWVPTPEGIEELLEMKTAAVQPGTVARLWDKLERKFTDLS